MGELDACRKSYGDHYIRISGFDASPGWEAVRLSFVANRPKAEPRFRLTRAEAAGRTLRYTTHADQRG